MTLLAFELMTMALAQNFDTASKPSRKRSAQLLADLFVKLQSVTRPDLILEIGAHEASFSQNARRVAPSATVVAFEASPHNYAYFSKRTPFAELGIEYLNMAASDESGSVTFNIKSSQEGRQLNPIAGNSSLLLRVEPGVEYEQVVVPAVTISDFVESRGLHGSRTNCWIDVEGATKQVFSGFGDTISQCQAIFCEVEESERWRGQWLRGDVTAFLFENNFVPISRDFQWPGQYNILFLRTDILDSSEVRALLTSHHSRLGVEARARSTKLS